MKADTLQQSGQHPIDLLAFYVNGTLAGSERGEVEAHLSACPSCRREAEEWEELAFAVEEEPVALPDSRLAWERLEKRIGEERRLQRETREPKPPVLAWWRSSSLAWGLAVAQLALVIGLVLYIAAVRPVGTAWTTLGGSPGPSKGEGVRLLVILQEDAAASEIAELLASVEGQIVSGPTAQGAYVVAITGTERAEAESAVALFRSRPDLVKWVQRENL